MLKTLTTTALLVLSLSACGSSATLVRKDGIGGRVELQGGYMGAMSDARGLMVDHCGGRYQAVELGDSVEFKCRKAAPFAASNGAIATATGSARGL